MLAAQASPAGGGGIESLDTDTFRLQCFQTLTGIKFFITAALGTPDIEAALRAIYDLYVDYVLKVGGTRCRFHARCYDWSNA